MFAIYNDIVKLLYSEILKNVFSPETIPNSGRAVLPCTIQLRQQTF